MIREYKPTVPEIAPLVRALYRSPRAAAGCCLHITLDDGNVEDSSVEYCIARAEEAGHAYCGALARALRSMSKTQRLKLRSVGYGYEPPEPSGPHGVYVVTEMGDLREPTKLIRVRTGTSGGTVNGVVPVAGHTYVLDPSVRFEIQSVIRADALDGAEERYADERRKRK
jgi:hypothetical protein